VGVGGYDPKRQIPSAHAQYCLAMKLWSGERRGSAWVMLICGLSSGRSQ
jgi:hypothetical protein